MQAKARRSRTGEARGGLVRMLVPDARARLPVRALRSRGRDVELARGPPVVDEDLLARLDVAGCPVDHVAGRPPLGEPGVRVGRGVVDAPEAEHHGDDVPGLVPGEEVAVEDRPAALALLAPGERDDRADLDHLAFPEVTAGEYPAAHAPDPADMQVGPGAGVADGLGQGAGSVGGGH